MTSFSLYESSVNNKKSVTFSSFVTECYLPLPLDIGFHLIFHQKGWDSALISESDPLLNLPFSQSQVW